MLKLILVMMFALAPRRPYDQMRSVAESVLAAAGDDLRHARVLVTIHLHENGFRTGTRLAYGLTGLGASTRPLEESARIALRSWLHSRAICGTDERAFRRYVTGRCGAIPSDVGRYGDAREYAATLCRIRAF